MAERDLEISMNNLCSDQVNDVPWCLVCGIHEQQLPYRNIFENMLLCSQRKLGTCLAATLLTDFEVDSAVSQVICGSCQELVEKSDLLETQLLSVQEELRTLHYNTLWMLESGKLHFVKPRPTAPLEPRKKPRKVQQVPRQELPYEPSKPEPRKCGKRRPPLERNMKSIYTTVEPYKGIKRKTTSLDCRQGTCPLDIETNIAPVVDKDVNGVSDLAKRMSMSLTSVFMTDQNEECLKINTTQEANCLASVKANLKRKRRKKKKERSNELQILADTSGNLELYDREEYAEPESDEDRKDRDPDFQLRNKPAKKLRLSQRLRRSKSASRVKKSSHGNGQFVDVKTTKNSSSHSVVENSNKCNVATTSMTKECIIINSIDVEKVNISSDLRDDITGDDDNFGNISEDPLKINSWEDDKNYSINEELIIKEELNSDYDTDGISNEMLPEVDTNNIKCENDSVKSNSDWGAYGNEQVDNMCIKLKQMFASPLDPQLKNSLQSNSKEDLSMICGISNINFATSIKLHSENEIGYRNSALPTDTLSFIRDHHSDLGYICDICGLDFDTVERLKNHIELDHFTPNY